MENVAIQWARQEFFDEGRLPVASVRQPVLRSWARCIDLGMVERQLPASGPLTEEDLRVYRQRHEALRRLCRPEMETLAGEARETGSVVILTDGDGMVLDRLGDPAFASRASELALQPGVSWREAEAGTNAIGVAIAERKPSVISGGEHFFAGHGIFRCAATPIVDPRGAVIGVLDVTGPATPGPGHALGMVRMAVDQIEHRLFRQRFEDCRLLRFHDDPAMVDTSREGILVFREERLVAANRRGLSLVGATWDSLDESVAGELFEERVRYGGQVQLRLSTGASAVGWWDEGPSGRAATNGPIDRFSSWRSSGKLAEREAEMIDVALNAAGGNVSRAARELGIHRSTIHRHKARRS